MTFLFPSSVIFFIHVQHNKVKSILMTAIGMSQYKPH